MENQAVRERPARELVLVPDPSRERHAQVNPPKRRTGRALHKRTRDGDALAPPSGFGRRFAFSRKAEPDASAVGPRRRDSAVKLKRDRTGLRSFVKTGRRRPVNAAMRNSRGWNPDRDDGEERQDATETEAHGYHLAATPAGPIATSARSPPSLTNDRPPAIAPKIAPWASPSA